MLYFSSQQNKTIGITETVFKRIFHLSKRQKIKFIINNVNFIVS
jgi:hypothetical protein